MKIIIVINHSKKLFYNHVDIFLNLSRSLSVQSSFERTGLQSSTDFLDLGWNGLDMAGCREC